MYKISTIVNNMLAARREGDLINAKIWADRLDEVLYIW